MIGEMDRQKFQPSTSAIGNLDAKYMILIAYLGGGILGLIPGVKYAAWLIPLIIFLVDKDNKFIAFHAIQALLLQVAAVVVYIILAIIGLAAVAGSAMMGNGLGVAAAGIIFVVLAAIVGIAILVFAILATVRGYSYEIYEIPLVGKFAEKIVFKTA